MANYRRPFDKVQKTERIIYTLDDMSDPRNRNILCVQIAKIKNSHDGETDINALFLEPTGGADDEYKRVGIAQTPKDVRVHGWDVRTVTII
jgi:hypothetical protein